MIPGLLLALASALATNVAFLLKYRGAIVVAPIEVRHPLRSAAALVRSQTEQHEPDVSRRSIVAPLRQ